MPFTASETAAMFDPALTTDAVYTPQGGAASAIKVIFDNEYRAVNIETGQVESAGPQATCKTSDVANAKHGETLVINSTTYYIIEIQPDGTGFTILILSRNA